MKRINFLDGFRGLAILLVIMFHSFSRWPRLVPYGYDYKDILLFKSGYLGVNLFFLISGFVILMSLEKSKSFWSFLYKRWKRLFPAMLVATILIYFSLPLFSERPAGMSKLNSVIPGLFFIDQDWISLFTNIKIKPIEGAFWTLFVEFKFYFIFGLLFFLLDKFKAIAAISVFYILFLIATKFDVHFLYVITTFWSFNCFGWFAMGALAYLYYQEGKIKYIYLYLILGVLQQLVFKKLDQSLFSVGIIFLFLLPIYFEKTRFIFENWFFLFLGMISYPLYLVHENALIAMIIKEGKWFPQIPGYLMPIVPLLFLCLLAYIITKHLEPFVANSILKIEGYLKRG